MEKTLLRKEEIQNKIRLNLTELKKKYPIHQFYLFGSYARDEQSENSDIDILIDFEPEQENFDNYMAVCELIEKLFENQKVEIVTKNGLSPYIGPKILNDVKYV